MNEKFKKLNLSLIIAIVAFIVYDVCLIFLNINAISYANGQLPHQKFMESAAANKLEHLINITQIATWFIVATLIILVIALIITIINRAKADKTLQLIIIGLCAIVGIVFIIGLAFGTPILALATLLLLIPAYRGYKELNSEQLVVQQVYAQQ